MPHIYISEKLLERVDELEKIKSKLTSLKEAYTEAVEKKFDISETEGLKTCLESLFKYQAALESMILADSIHFISHRNN